MSAFNELASKVAKQYHKAKGYSPKHAAQSGAAVAAAIGRKKYGAKAFAAMAAAGRKK